MPNFKCKSIKSLVLPFTQDEVSFLWICHDARSSLLFVKIVNEHFFLQIVKQNDAFVIKAEKHSKPTQIGYVQKALLVFKNTFAKDVISEAFALKKTHLLKKNKFIENDILSLLENTQKYNRVYLEIGFGSGRHLLYQARENPNILILGVEIYMPALEQVANLAMKEGLDNILLMQNDARLLLSVLKNHCLAKIFLHFPVPWDKQPQRRVVSLDFVKNCQRVLQKGGCFELRTDSKAYLDFTLQQFLTLQTCKAQINKNADLGVTSKYEARWKRQEKDIYDLCVYNETFDDNELACFDFKLKDFKPLMSVEKLKQNFAKKHFRGEDYFLSLENMYVKDEQSVVLKIAFGSFYSPEHMYLLFDEKLSFLFNEPFKTEQNFKALQKLLNFLNQEI
ncbi:tRNA (guanosine(46)-N7)-methyltransferase TrmB [Campylobacter sp. MIT 97-5078]|uniref:tRNA (guanosine(46)-N7)-methyltransferase TrmB n=1 Tax=Campylobacter sp. MIT 97-5078 TaxID=1548153 RepID=UPI0005135D76|nr:tRNA (guanosine(46)-N7)-methyltransferase TrmB [Campylobacter sp. MIT 97-5078]KGI56376.1 tRNA (guanine-N7)-methyltransferase [Campylobacter sp. MIT 97-5078]KGI56880.1 tRNA (guanine-N7)-methyltransferase [Campylobacter sp. MIT 97-5078]KGI56909.1 tRNA (guanine-N7)-methyltransferase [Campylobacter sp. MIT 97-5078]TQR26711.1 tRNA (guanosine(46)-N7)-methyltransferase TrmB [Campylobacter sp. MIT 97-5078]